MQDASILIVEDHGINQLVAKLILQKAGYQVETADDGLEAVHACGRRHYHLVLMDLHMPRLDGFSATRQIRNEHLQRQKIVAVTADVTRDVTERCKNAGMDGYLAKPYSMKQLLHIAKQFVSA